MREVSQRPTAAPPLVPMSEEDREKEEEDEDKTDIYVVSLSSIRWILYFNVFGALQ